MAQSSGVCRAMCRRTQEQHASSVQGATGWSTLPHEVKLKILSFVRPEKEKFAMRFVSKDWQKLLESPDAYGKDTYYFGFRDCIDSFPLRFLEHIRSIDVNLEGLVTFEKNALASMAAAANLKSLHLGLEDPYSISALPYLGKLSYLGVSVNESYEYDEKVDLDRREGNPIALDGRLFPSLKELAVLDFDPAHANALCAALSHFHNLNSVNLGYTEAPDLDVMPTCSFPVSCSVLLDLGACGQWCADSTASLPGSLARCVTKVGMYAPGHMSTIDLSFLADCARMKELVVARYASSTHLCLQGIEKLPSGLQNFEVNSYLSPTVTGDAVTRIERRANKRSWLCHLDRAH